ncbi:hypothetical protein BGZ83_011142 [Gryganskiella cystojenkinii]|nr:hypothetical protein BGZ83_011142 [Gryganskiella cystojenkinii]
MATNPSRPDKIWTGDDILFVAEAESGVKVPPGTFLATKFVRMIDPSFVTDAIFNSHRPWVGSPLISAMNVLRVWTSESEDRGRPSPGSTNAAPRGETEAWINYGENRLEEHGVDLLFSASSKPREETAPVRDRHMKTTTRSTTSWWRSRPDPDKRQVSGDKEKKTLAVAGMTPYQRRRFFTKAEHREAALLRPRLIIAGDFFNNFTDFERAQAKMVITIQFDRVLQGQTLRFVCKSRAKEEQKIGSKVADPGAVALEDTPIHPGDKSNTRRTAEEDAAVFFVVELEWT